MIRQIIKRCHPENVLVFGCSAENDSAQFAAIPGVTHVVTGEAYGGNRIAAVLAVVGECVSSMRSDSSAVSELSVPSDSSTSLVSSVSLVSLVSSSSVSSVSPSSASSVIFDSCTRSLESGLRRFGERHRAYVKVQDGCRQFCTYCLIPHLRHELTSVPVEEVQTEVRSLLRHGYREIIITGIHLGYYGLNPRGRSQMVWRIEDRQKPRQTNLTDLMERLAKMELEPVCGTEAAFSEPEFRLRISSLEAHEAGDDLLQIMAENRARICPHLHLSMQSGSPSVHHRMNRPGTIEQYVERCESAKRILDQPALTTDVIVGFPGETEQEFLETCDVVRRIGFSKIHIFPFSARPGTPAARLGGFIPNEEKHRRELYLAEIEREMHEKFVESLKGRQTQFLIERFHSETQTVTGTSEYYLQEEFPGSVEDVGRFLMR